MSFIEQLSQIVNEQLKQLDNIPVLESGVPPKVGVVELLKMALKNELEASELAARWLPSVPEIDVKLGLARQCGDEAKHYRLIAQHLEAMGIDLTNFSPLAQGYSPLFQWLTTLETTVERLAAGPFVREAIAVKRNAQLIVVLEALGDEASAQLYRAEIQPDEQWHHNFGQTMLAKYATTDALQAQAEQAALQTLKLADELRSAAMAKTGACVVPGC